MLKSIKTKLIRLFKSKPKVSLAQLTAQANAQWPNQIYTIHDTKSGSATLYKYPKT